TKAPPPAARRGHSPRGPARRGARDGPPRRRRLTRARLPSSGVRLPAPFRGSFAMAADSRGRAVPVAVGAGGGGAMRKLTRRTFLRASGAGAVGAALAGGLAGCASTMGETQPTSRRRVVVIGGGGGGGHPGQVGR